VLLPVTAVPCPACGVQVEWTADSRYRPFCSERCKLLDLSGWLLEEYRIPAAPPSAGPGATAEDAPEPYDP
jgi:uncharacterized protein